MYLNKFSQIISLEQEIYYVTEPNLRSPLDIVLGDTTPHIAHKVNPQSFHCLWRGEHGDKPMPFVVNHLAQDCTASLLAQSNLFTEYEREYCFRKPIPLLSAAGIWCAKQAFMKSVTQRLRLEDFNYLDFEIRHHHSGQPQIRLKEGSLKRQFEIHSVNTALAISHTKTLATAIVLLWRTQNSNLSKKVRF